VLRSGLKELDPRQVFNLARGMFALAISLPKFFRERITLEQAEAEIKRALESREESFLELIRTRVYENPSSPYLRLLKVAGCDFSDLRSRLRQHGLEGALERLATEGVYLTSDEFRGKKEVVRGKESFRVCPADFQRPGSAPGFAAQSGGSRSQPVPSVVPLDARAVRTWATAVYFSAHDLFSYSHAVYDAILPGTGPSKLMGHAELGIRTDRWFARKIPVHGRLQGRYHYLTTYLIVWMGKLFGPGFPRPEFIDVEDVGPIVRWASEQLRVGKRCCIRATASDAVRIARAAWEKGVSLEGTKFSVNSEPFTESKREVIERVGASATSRYSFSGAGTVGGGCARPRYTDEVHVNTHALAVISRPWPLTDDGRSVRPLLFTSLHPSMPVFLLNVENGDYATLDRRDCGCAMEKIGLTLHLHHIRSYEKLTSEGMNYFYGDLYEFVEKILPSEFGGGPGDYQLVEEEDENSQTRLILVVRPEVGEVDEAKLLLRLEEQLAQGSSANRFQAKIWQDAGTLRVKRAVPHASARGKILPLHISR
jgi:hypothetical protein